MKPRPRLDGSSLLTPADLQVLQYLPAQLTFAEIGSRLGLPSEIVRRQVINIYRKLGVVSRAEAVKRGLVLGLIAREPDPNQRPTAFP